VTTASVEAGLKGSSEGAIVAAASQGSTNAPGATGSAAQAAAESLNPSTASAATSGSTTGTTSPQRDPSAGTGTDNPTTPQAKVVVQIKPPTA
jgi:hypothetical protein